MTREQWKLIRPGDVVLDRAHGDARRRIHTIKTVSGTRGQGVHTRYALTVDNLKQSGKTTIVFVSENTGPKRFDLASRVAGGEPVERSK